ncbi:MAG: GtrA family protein [Hydrogenoanaerobacterium sp.]
MIDKIEQLIRKYREEIAYLFFGGLTVLVNILLFAIFDLFLGEITANTIAFLLSVQFAYMTNTKFVFCALYTRQNFLQFWGMRIGTIFIDNGGMWLLLATGCNKFIAKIIVNAVVIVLNYIFSKFFIYRKKGE